MDYKVKLKTFEGPLDLLLHLIYKNEVDILDIPVATITDQYLEYVEVMQSLNIDVAGDFLLMAATLIHIKSKMLLPIFSEDKEDPREEITRPLLEYMQFKEAAQDLSKKEILNRDVFARETPAYFEHQAKNEGASLEVNVFQLIDAFKRVLDRQKPDISLRIKSDRWTIKEKMEVIMSRLKQNGAMFFEDLFDNKLSAKELVIIFLAMLELVHMGLIKIYQPSLNTDIRLVPCAASSEKDINGNAV